MAAASSFPTNHIIIPSKSPPNYRSYFNPRPLVAVPGSFQQHKLNRNPQQPTTIKTTSFVKVNEDQDVHLGEKPPLEKETVIMSPAEQIVQLAKSLAARPAEFAMDVLCPPGTPVSQVSLRLFLAAAAVFAVLPGDSWEWWTGEAVVSGGLVFYSVFYLLISVTFFGG